MDVLDRGEPIAKIVAVGRVGALVVREQRPGAPRRADVHVGPPLKLKPDPVALLLEDRERVR